MAQSGPLKRRGFMKLGMKCGLAFLTVRHVGGGFRGSGVHGTADARIRRILGKYGSEFGGTAGLKEN